MLCTAGSPPHAYRAHYSAWGLPPGLRYGHSCSLLLGSTLGPASAFPYPPGGAQLADLLALLRWAHLLLCRKTRSGTTCANPSAEEPGSGGKQTRCPSCTSKACSSGHHDSNTLGGLLAIVHSFPAGSLRIHHTGHLEELICSIQSYEPILPKQWVFIITTGCFGQLPGQGPPSMPALRLSQALGLIFSHFVNWLQEHPVTQA